MNLSYQNNEIKKENIIGEQRLDDRMKKYENQVDSKIIIRPSESYIVRLDGRTFSKFTKKFVKPFDLVFIKAMSLTMRDLVEEFDAQTGYTHSDEIILVFNAKCTESEEFDAQTFHQNKYKITLGSNSKCIKSKEVSNHMFRGRVQKIISLTSSFCSVRFNFHLANLIEPIKMNYDAKLVELIKSHKQMFDSRIIIFQESIKYEILNHQIWRSVHDCERNAILTYAHTYFGPQKILCKNCETLIIMLNDEKYLDWILDIPTFIKHGIYCKKNLIYKEINGQKVLRTEYVFKEFKIFFSQENLNMIMNKYWNMYNEESKEITDSNVGNTLNLNTIKL